MEILDLKAIYPNSFVDYKGRRVAEITLQGKKPKNRIKQRLKIEGITVTDYVFDPVNNRTVISVQSMNKAFLPVEENIETIPIEEEIFEEEYPESAEELFEKGKSAIVVPPVVSSTEMEKDHNWKEDYSQINGCCENTCSGCNEKFFGHSKRIMCKPCMKAHVSASKGTVVLPK